MKKFSIILAFAFFGTVVILSAVVSYLGKDIAEPDVSDLALERPDIPDEQNAFICFVSITNLIYWPTNCEVIVDFIEEELENTDSVDEIIAKNQEAFELVKQAVELERCVAPEIDGFDVRLTYLGPWRNVARVMAAKVRRDRLKGNYVDAVDTCAALLKFGDFVQRDAGSIIHYLLGIAILDIGLGQAQDLARDNKISEEELKQMGKIIDELGPFESGLMGAIKVEHNIVSNTIDQFVDGEFGMDGLIGFSEDSLLSFFRRKRIKGYFFQPNKTKKSFADIYRGVIKNAPLCYGDMTFPDVEEVLGLKMNRLQLVIRPNAIGKILYSLLLPATSRLLERKTRAVWRVDSTRVLIATHKFKKANGGFPEKIEDLLPEYITAIPMDPYDGKTIRYSFKNGIIYSVGEDLVDDGGVFDDSGKEGTPSGCGHRAHNPDLVLEI